MTLTATGMISIGISDRRLGFLMMKEEKPMHVASIRIGKTILFISALLPFKA